MNRTALQLVNAKYRCQSLRKIEMSVERRRSRLSTESTGGPHALRRDRHEPNGARRGGCLWAPGDNLRESQPPCRSQRLSQP